MSSHQKRWCDLFKYSSSLILYLDIVSFRCAAFLSINLCIHCSNFLFMFISLFFFFFFTFMSNSVVFQVFRLLLLRYYVSRLNPSTGKIEKMYFLWIRFVQWLPKFLAFVDFLRIFMEYFSLPLSSPYLRMRELPSVCFRHNRYFVSFLLFFSSDLRRFFFWLWPLCLLHHFSTSNSLTWR